MCPRAKGAVHQYVFGYPSGTYGCPDTYSVPDILEALSGKTWPLPKTTDTLEHFTVEITRSLAEESLRRWFF